MGRVGLVRDSRGHPGIEDNGRVLSQAGLGKAGARGVSYREVWWPLDAENNPVNCTILPR